MTIANIAAVPFAVAVASGDRCAPPCWLACRCRRRATPGSSVIQTSRPSAPGRAARRLLQLGVGGLYDTHGEL